MNFHEQALIHSGICLSLLNEGRRKDALRYCIEHHIEPPHCPAQLNELGDAEITHLGDYGWWLKRLKITTKRDVEKQKVKVEEV